MVSPWVCRRRLAAELLHLRELAGWSAEKLCREIGIQRQTLSRLENARVRPDQDVVMKILDRLEIPIARWRHFMAISRDAQEHGWWEKHRDEMGPRQALYADLEAGASHIAEYHLTLLPGLLQIPAYTEARALADRATYPTQFAVDHAVQARATRQRILDRPDGPTYDVVIDELAIRRHAAIDPIVRAQLDHLIHAGHHRPKITIRVLPLTARIRGHAIPRTAFYAYRYPDPDDPIVVAVDTITDDLVHTRPADVAPYLDLYQRLTDAALTPADSLELLAATAQDLPDYTRSRP